MNIINKHKDGIGSEIVGKSSDIIVRKTVSANNVVVTYDTRSPDSTGNINTCKFRTIIIDVTVYPYDTQTCTITFASENYHSPKMNFISQNEYMRTDFINTCKFRTIITRTGKITLNVKNKEFRFNVILNSIILLLRTSMVWTQADVLSKTNLIISVVVCIATIIQLNLYYRDESTSQIPIWIKRLYFIRSFFLLLFICSIEEVREFRIKYRRFIHIGICDVLSSL
jgi:hypothetical protein